MAIHPEWPTWWDIENVRNLGICGKWGTVESYRDRFFNLPYNQTSGSNSHNNYTTLKGISHPGSYGDVPRVGTSPYGDVPRVGTSPFLAQGGGLVYEEIECHITRTGPPRNRSLRAQVGDRGSYHSALSTWGWSNFVHIYLIFLISNM